MRPIGCIFNEVDLNKASLWLMIPFLLSMASGCRSQQLSQNLEHLWINFSIRTVPLTLASDASNQGLTTLTLRVRQPLSGRERSTLLWLSHILKQNRLLSVKLRPCTTFHVASIVLLPAVIFYPHLRTIWHLTRCSRQHHPSIKET